MKTSASKVVSAAEISLVALAPRLVGVWSAAVRRDFEQAIETLRGGGEIWGLGIVLSLAAGLRILRGDFHDAHALATEAMSIYRDLEDPRGVAWTLDVQAGLAAANGKSDEAAQLWGASDAMLESVGGSLVPTIGWIRDRYLEETAARLGPHVFERARKEGRTMSFEQAVHMLSG